MAGIIAQIGISFAVYNTLETGFTAENAEAAETRSKASEKLKSISASFAVSVVSKDLDRQGFVDIYKESMQWQ